MKKNILNSSNIILQNYRSISQHFTEKNKIILFGFSIILFSSVNILSINDFINSASALEYQSTEQLQFTVNPTVSITVSGNLTISNLSPGSTSDSNIITVTASSNAISGYSLSSTVGDSNNASTELRKDNTNTTYKFSSITTNKPTLSDFDTNSNTWGYSYSTDSGSTWISGDITGTTSSGYNGLPLYTTDTPITLINATSEGTNTIEFKIGASATQSQVAGEYNNIINFIAISNPNPEPVYMQNWDGCSTMAIGNVVTLVDSRDYQTYLVGKAKDNNCWMLQNLKLGKGANSLNLTQADSNVGPNGFTLDGKLADGKFHAYTIDDVPYQNNSSEYYCTDDYGCYYNWYAATAGSGTTYIESGNTDYDICPNNWTLPIDGQNSQFQVLYNQYPSATQMLVDNPTTSTENTTGKIPGFLLSGSYTSGGSNGVGSTGFFNSRSAKDKKSNFSIYIGRTTVVVANDLNKYNGLPIRCIAK